MPRPEKSTEAALPGGGSTGQIPDLLFECDAFSGSLSTLFLLARDGRVDLLGVPLAPLCEAYFRHILESEGKDIEGCAGALAALAYLLERKSFHALPRTEVEEDEPDRDTDLDFGPGLSLPELQPAIEALRELRQEAEGRFFRSPEAQEGYLLPLDIGEVQPADLARAFARLLAKASPEPPELTSAPRRSLAEQMREVLAALRSEPVSLVDLLPVGFTKTDAVWWFLALLELIRLGQARAVLAEDDVLFSRGGDA
ncbi:MAG: hypothetical protein MH204_12605 [Fimbriimonadaceae bacterium]|nr:hypothetical protein [Fimbriimonadaceae bacterium]